jgi:hypothetical protein
MPPPTIVKPNGVSPAPQIGTPPSPPAIAAARSNPFDAAAVTANTQPLPDRICLYTPPKWGKSSFAAQAEGVVFLTTKGEDGIMVLKKTGLAPAAVRCFPKPATEWPQLLSAIASLTKNPPPYFCLDTLNGAESLCFAHVCQRDHGGDWGDKGFSNFQVGYRTTGPREFERLFDALEGLREAGSHIICLAHTANKTRKNPDGPDYDVSRPALAEDCWALAARRFDILLQGTFDSVVTANKRNPMAKGKASGGSHRIIRAQPGASFEAGGRYPLPEEIDCGQSAADAWKAFQDALKIAPAQ